MRSPLWRVNSKWFPIYNFLFVHKYVLSSNPDLYLPKIVFQWMRAYMMLSQNLSFYSNHVNASNCLLSFRCLLVSFPCDPFPEALYPSDRTSIPGPANLRCGNTYLLDYTRDKKNNLRSPPSPSEGQFVCKYLSKSKHHTIYEWKD